MTVSSQVKQTLASLKNIEASLTSFAHIAQHNEAQNVYSENAQKAHHMILNLQNRVKELEMEEPQYKGM